jgi:hypothetical protein
MCVSNVGSASGDCLLQHIWTGDTLRRRRESPSSPRRPPRWSLDLALWQRSSLAPLIHSRLNLHLRSSLGDWHSPPPNYWLFLYSPSTDQVYQRSGALWIHCRRSGLRVNRRLHHGTFCRIPDWCCDLPSDSSCCTDVRRTRTSVTLLSIGRHCEVVLAPSPTELATAITIVDPQYLWATETLLHTDNGVAVAQAIRDGTGLAVSDGSFKDSRSTSAFLLEGSAGASGRIYGTNRVPGQRMDQDSYRGELGGILGVLHTAHCVATINGMWSGRLRLGLNGEEAMKQAAIVGPIHPKMRSFDLLAEIRALRSPLAFTVNFFWIEGHQHERHGKEDYYGYLNNLCDNLAKAFWNQTTTLDTFENVRVNFTSWGFRYEGVWPGQFSSTDFYDTTFGKKFPSHTGKMTDTLYLLAA